MVPIPTLDDVLIPVSFFVKYPVPKPATPPAKSIATLVIPVILP